MSAPRTATAAVQAAVHHQAARDRLWDAVIDGDEYAAVAVVFGAVDAGSPCEDVLLDVIAPVQHRVGSEWAANRITVAQEHAATAINERVVAALADHPAARTQAGNGRVTVACVDGEWHALPARLLAEVLRLRGWQVSFLGAQVPTPHLIADLHRNGPDAVALSCSIPTRLPTAHAAITACQAAGVPVIAGGAAFGVDGRYARLLGADAWAGDARTAAQRLADGVARTRPADSHQAIDDLPHLADQEYTMVRDSATELVRAVVAELARRATSDGPEPAGQYTAADVAHTVDFLATALYTDDDDIFVGYVTWTAEILNAREVAGERLPAALELLALRLRDFPRAQRIIAAATRALFGLPAESGVTTS